MEELTALYQNADLFLCMSEHEGFCIPIIEAMYFEVPVIAFASSAVPETAGDAGIIFHKKHFPYIAHLMHEVLSNAPLQANMKKAGKKRAEYFSKENASVRFIKLIKECKNDL
jgi:glycosyltransferase involved in cell wall biosynthesis